MAPRRPWRVATTDATHAGSSTRPVATAAPCIGGSTRSYHPHWRKPVHQRGIYPGHSRQGNSTLATSNVHSPAVGIRPLDRTHGVYTGNSFTPHLPGRPPSGTSGPPCRQMAATNASSSAKPTQPHSTTAS